MKISKILVAALLSAVLLASCSSSGRMGKSGGCSCHKGMVGY